MRYLTRTVVCVALCVLCFASPAFALFVVTKKGLWPKNWPDQLETLREKSVTYEGPKRPFRCYAIPLNTREEFESIWPHIVKVKSPGAPIVLRRGPSYWFGGENGRWFDGEKKTGVCIHTPPEGDTPTTGYQIRRESLEQTIYIELIVDGEIIDLNRIQLPPDTPIIDERFKEPESK